MNKGIKKCSEEKTTHGYPVRPLPSSPLKVRIAFSLTLVTVMSIMTAQSTEIELENFWSNSLATELRNFSFWDEDSKTQPLSYNCFAASELRHIECKFFHMNRCFDLSPFAATSFSADKVRRTPIKRCAQRWNPCKRLNLLVILLFVCNSLSPYLSFFMSLELLRSVSSCSYVEVFKMFLNKCMKTMFSCSQRRKRQAKTKACWNEVICAVGRGEVNERI